MAGVARFELSVSRDFKPTFHSPWLKSQANGDFIVKQKILELTPATRYFFRVVYGPDKNTTFTGAVGSFSTLQRQTGIEEVSFVVVTGMNYASFNHGQLGKRDRKTNQRIRDITTSYHGKDKSQGFPAL